MLISGGTGEEILATMIREGLLCQKNSEGKSGTTGR